MSPLSSELYRFQTSDGQTLHGLLLRPNADAASDMIAVYGHGVANNFYTTPLLGIAEQLVTPGRHALVYNWRGHDWVSRGGDGTEFCGAAYERMEDAPLDLDGLLASLGERGYRRFILVGHSLGAVKTVHYQGLRQRQDVAAVAACSPPRTYYSNRVQEQADFPAALAEAQRHVDAGQPEAFVWAITSSSMGFFTARTFLSKYGPEADTDIRPYAAKLGVPFMGLAGGAEAESFTTHVEELAAAVGPRGQWHVVPNANHSYTGDEAKVITCLGDWLTSLGL